MQGITESARIDSLYYHCLRILADNPRLIIGPKLNEYILEDLMTSIKDPLYLKNIEWVKVRVIFRGLGVEALIAKKYLGDHVTSSVINEPVTQPRQTRVPGVMREGAKNVIEGYPPIGVDLSNHMSLRQHILRAPRHILDRYRHKNQSAEHGAGYYCRVYTQDYWDIVDVADEAERMEFISPAVLIPKCVLHNL